MRRLSIEGRSGGWSPVRQDGGLSRVRYPTKGAGPYPLDRVRAAPGAVVAGLVRYVLGGQGLGYPFELRHLGHKSRPSLVRHPSRPVLGAQHPVQGQSRSTRTTRPQRATAGLTGPLRAVDHLRSRGARTRGPPDDRCGG